MTRLGLLLIPFGAGPALAHPGTEIHLHSGNHVSLFLGLGLIVAGIGAAIYMRGRAR